MGRARLLGIAATVSAAAALAAPASANTIRAGAYSGINLRNFVVEATVGHGHNGGFVLRSFSTTVRVHCASHNFNTKVSDFEHVAIPASGTVAVQKNSNQFAFHFKLTFDGDKATGSAGYGRHDGCHGSTTFTIHRQHHQ